MTSPTPPYADPAYHAKHHFQGLDESTGSPPPPPPPLPRAAGTPPYSEQGTFSDVIKHREMMKYGSQGKYNQLYIHKY